MKICPQTPRPDTNRAARPNPAISLQWNAFPAGTAEVDAAFDLSEFFAGKLGAKHVDVVRNVVFFLH